jgi:hypothetical protein
MGEPEEWDPPAGWDPMEAIIRGLIASAAGEPYNEDELLLATMLCAVVTLQSKGLDQATAMRVVDQCMEKGDIHISYSEADGLEMSIGDHT